MIDIEGQPLRGQRFIDLFCGIGGFHLALSSFGAECVFASDIDENAKDVYEKNFGFRPDGDITKIDVKEIPKHDIICAGFPCQPFSISGKKNGFKDKKRGNLFYNVVKIARAHKPNVILLENVRNFENHNNGKTMKRVREALNGIGYDVYSKVLCASDYGVPQARKRIYIVAFRSDLNIKNFSFPEILKKYKTLNEVLINETENEIKGNYMATYLARIGTEKEEIHRRMIEYYPKLGKAEFTLDYIRPGYGMDELGWFVSCQGSVPQALQAFFESTDFESAIRNAISIGGDSDTLACMAGAVAEAYYGVPEEIKKESRKYLTEDLLEILDDFEQIKLKRQERQTQS